MIAVHARRRAILLGGVMVLAGLAPVGPAAHATTTVTNHYECYEPGPTSSEFGKYVGPVDLSIAMTGWEGWDEVPAAQWDWPELSFDSQVTIPEELYADVAGRGAQTVEMSRLSMLWSDGRQGPNMSAVGEHWAVDPTFSFDEFAAGQAGRTAGFAATDDTDLFPTRAGTYGLLSPTQFSMSYYDSEGGYVFIANCVVDPEVGAAPLHHVRLFKTESITTARAARAAFTVGEPATVKVEVTSPEWRVWADGRVQLKGPRGTVATATLKKSKAVLTTRSLPVGTHKLKVVFGGDGRYLGSKTPVTVVVKR